MAEVTGQLGAEQPGKVPATPATNTEKTDRLSGYLGWARGQIGSRGQDARKKFLKLIGRIKPKVKPLDKGKIKFWTREKTYNYLIDPLQGRINNYLDRLGAIKNDPDTSQPQKEEATTKLLSELEAEMRLAYKNAKEYLYALKGGASRLATDCIAELSVSGPEYERLMNSPEGKGLRDIFGEFINGASLSQDHKKVLDEAINSYNQKKQDLVYFILSLARTNVREKYIKAYIANKDHMKIDVQIFLERGSQYGHFSLSDMKRMFEYCVKTGKGKNDPRLVAFGNEKLKMFEDTEAGRKERTIYEKRYEAAKAITEKAKEAINAHTAKGGLQKMGTMTGLGKAIGYLASVATIAANTFANKDILFNNPVEFFKNPYLLTAGGLLLWLNQNRKGETVADFFKGSKGKEKMKKEEALKSVKKRFEKSFVWTQFFESNKAVEIFADYSNYLRENEYPSLKDFRERLHKNDGETAGQFEALMKQKTGKLSDSEQEIKVGGELVEMVTVFQVLEISTLEDFKNLKAQLNEMS
ncbi:hypothetical protein HOE67_03790 [Candidatus Peregrinibacteria bacterium]|jgi:hypothetical protein|nr:hypothetical protein [Candidatus Peregrinibacteria bacterium]MBT4056208.1 hypothetical protein [Candidatus Peregrinibacteria bacterium]